MLFENQKNINKFNSNRLIQNPENHEQERITKKREREWDKENKSIK